MYPIEVKKRVIEMLKNKVSVKDISKELGVSETTIYRWKKEFKKRKKIKQLARKGRFEEAKAETAELKGKVNESIRFSLLAMIERRKGNIEESKRLEEQVLEREPDNVTTINNLLEMARAEGNIEREKQLLDLRLTLNPKDERALSRLASLIRNEKCLKEKRGLNVEEELSRERELLERKFELKPEDIITINRLLTVVEDQGDIEREKELLRIKERVLQKIIMSNPDHKNAKDDLRRTRKKRKKLAQKTIVFKEGDDPTISPIRRARELIYDSKNIMEAAEAIKELLGEERTVESELVLAELYSNAGVIDRAKRELKRYASTLQEPKDVKTIKKAMQLLQNKRIERFSWETLWDQLDQVEQNTNKPIRYCRKFS